MLSVTSAELATLSFTNTLSHDHLRLRSRKMMIALSHAIEMHAADVGNEETILIAAFQRMSLFAREVERYASIASRLGHVFVVGVQDVPTQPVPGVIQIPIASDWPLVQEWVVIACGPTCCAALQSRDMDGYQPTRRSRLFAGRWTTRPNEVDPLVHTFFQALNLPTPSFTYDDKVGFRSANAIRDLLTTLS